MKKISWETPKHLRLVKNSWIVKNPPKKKNINKLIKSSNELKKKKINKL